MNFSPLSGLAIQRIGRHSPLRCQLLYLRHLRVWTWSAASGRPDRRAEYYLQLPRKESKRMMMAYYRYFRWAAFLLY